MCNPAEHRRQEARRETFTTPKLVTTWRSILGPPAEGRPGPSDDNDGWYDNHDDGDGNLEDDFDKNYWQTYKYYDVWIKINQV